MSQKKVPGKSATHKQPPKYTAPSERARLAWEKMLSALPEGDEGDRVRAVIEHAQSDLKPGGEALMVIAQDIVARVSQAKARSTMDATMMLLRVQEVMRLGDSELDRKAIAVIDAALLARRDPRRARDLDNMIEGLDELLSRRARFLALVEARLASVDADGRPREYVLAGAGEFDEAFATFDRARERELVAKQRNARSIGRGSNSVSTLAATFAVEARALGFDAKSDIEHAARALRDARDKLAAKPG